MDFMPELVNGGVVLMASNICNNLASDCKQCPESSVAIHNWLMSTNMPYLIVDFQDEKDICKKVLEEILQLRKRLRIPFLFAGLMERPRSYVTSYAYREYPFFETPEDAVSFLLSQNPSVLESDYSKVKFDENIPCSRPRQTRLDAEGEEIEGDSNEELDEASGDI